MKVIYFKNLARESRNEITEWMINNDTETMTVQEWDTDPDFWLVSDEDAEKLQEEFDYPDMYVYDEKDKHAISDAMNDGINWVYKTFGNNFDEEFGIEPIPDNHQLGYWDYIILSDKGHVTHPIKVSYDGIVTNAHGGQLYPKPWEE